MLLGAMRAACYLILFGELFLALAAERRGIARRTMADKGARHVTIADLATRFRDANDAAVVEALAALPALADESDPCWNDESYWRDVAYPFLALADVSAQRRLEPAVRMLLDRACYGDPGEIMRGLRHSLEAITAHDWDRLAVLCIDAAQSDRLGTQLWALDQLAVLEDPRRASFDAVGATRAPGEVVASGQVVAGARS